MLVKEAIRSLVILVAAAASAAAQPPESPPEDQKQVVSAAEIAQWVADLDSDRFAKRENATEQLIEAGRPAIQPLVDSLHGSNLEVTTRCIYVLRELALSDDPAVSDAARAALKQVGGNAGTSASRRALATLEVLNEVRQQRAVIQLESLGATLVRRHIQVGVQLVPQIYGLRIDEDWRGRLADLRRLRWLDDIQQVSLEGEQITDAWLEKLANMKSITMVEITRAKITDQGVASLAKLPRLQLLSLKYVPVTDASIESLQTMKGVGLFRFYGTKLTQAGGERLLAALPDGAQVDRRNGAFLGVGCEQLEQGCAVSLIHPGSAAFKAGLTEGDVIVKYEGQEVRDFQGLTKLISRNRGGDTVTLEIKRNGKTIRKKVTLGEWD